MAMLTYLSIGAMKMLFLMGLPARPAHVDGPMATPDSAQETKEASDADAPAPVADDPVVPFLDRLERAADDLRDFKADVSLITIDKLGRPTERVGNLIYQIKPEENQKRFAVTFEKEKAAGRFRRNRKQYVFDGRWLAEIDFKRKTFIKREVVPPGEQFDPLKLGEGPFPLPIGQKRDDVLAQFEVAFVDLPEDGPVSELKNVQGLRLTPKPGNRVAEQFHHVDVYYDLAALIPTGVVALDANELESRSVLLTNLSPNEGVDEAKLDINRPDEDGWLIEVKPFNQ